MNGMYIHEAARIAHERGCAIKRCDDLFAGDPERLARHKKRPQVIRNGEYESLAVELKAWLLQMGVEPHAALSHMDWTDISPIMDVHYRMHQRDAAAGDPQSDAAPELPPNYKRIYNNKGQLTYAAVDTEGFFADKPEYWQR